MKIYVNEFHEIKAVRENTTGDNALKEILVSDDFLQPFCDTVICSFCYKKEIDETGGEQISVYPYKDYSLLESIQEQNDIREVQRLVLMKSNFDLDFRISSVEMGF